MDCGEGSCVVSMSGFETLDALRVEQRKRMLMRGVIQCSCMSGGTIHVRV